MSQSPILLYDPDGGVVTGGDGDGGGIGQRQGNLYYWPDIQNLTGGVTETDLDAQSIYALPVDSLIIVVIESSGESTWLRANDATSPVTDTNAGVIVPTNYDAVDRPYVLRRQIGCALGGVSSSSFACPVEDLPTIAVTFSGIGFGCVDTSIRSFGVTNPDDLNVGFTLTGSTLGGWSYSAGFFTEVERYDDFACAGIHEPAMTTLNIQVFCDVDGFHVTISLDGTGISTSAVFEGTTAALTVPNSLPCGGSALITL